MGNCQAIDAATLVIQHPSGKVERFYSPMSARQVMKLNPGHCVALLISSTTMCTNKDNQNNTNTNTNTNTNRVRLTRIKLLKPNDTLLLGHVYRLITTQEVMKGLKEKKQAKMRKNMSDSAHKSDWGKTTRKFDTQENKAVKLEGPRPKTTTSTNNAASVTAKTRFWQPSLQSISEVAS